VFSIVYKDFYSDKDHEVGHYIANISESKDLYIVELSIPWNQPMLGGGFGFYWIVSFILLGFIIKGSALILIIYKT
jgi:hypothetical protein